MLRPNAVWAWDSSASVYLDLSDNINTNTAFDFLADANDIIYIGSERRFVGVYTDLSTAGSYSGLTYKYLIGEETWSSLALIDSYTFNESKYCRWNLPNNWACQQFTSTFPHAKAPPSDVEYFWLKLSATTVTTKAVISKIRLMPYATYTTPDKVSEFLQLKKSFDETTNPTDLMVENFIRRQEDYINYRTRKSWKLQAIVEDTDPILVDYSRYGFYLRHKNFAKIYSVKLWNGGSWETLVEGRNNDYHINYDLGMIIVSRMFNIPAVYGMTGRYAMWGNGEFKNSIKVDYLYGRNPETDSEFFMVEDICTKLVAKDLLQHHDYSHLLVSGSDKVPLESKIRLLTEDTENRIDNLISVALY